MFIWASIDKILHPNSFAMVIKDYQILPLAVVNFFAVILPYVELILGTMLVSGVWLQGAGLLTTVLLVIFWGALAFNVARGLDVHCGCFSSEARGNPTTTWYLIRDLFFVCMAGYFLRNVMREAR
jgi:hypothetical protein